MAEILKRDAFSKRSEELRDEIIKDRRWLHEHPELSFEEKETTAYIAKRLTELGIETELFPEYTGALATIHGAAPGKTVLLRADIDALPVPEATALPFASNTEGKMHACGHDCHAAMLLGAAKLLSESRQELCGTVKLLFQAAEESCVGSRYYVEHGCLDDVDAVFGLHVWGSMAAPFVNIQEGYRMAACDNFKITVRGYAAHGSTPQLSQDAIIAASSIILNLQTFASRRNDPLNPFVLTVGTIASGTQFNIIADTAVMEGTIRSFSPEVRKRTESGIRLITEETAKALGCTAELEYMPVEEAVINSSPGLTRLAERAAEKLFGREVLCSTEPVTCSEDFSNYLEIKPGVFVFLGCLNPELGITAPNHSEHFTVDESILPRGSALYAQFAADFLKQEAEA